MSTEQNKALVRRIFEEGLNQNKPDVFDELIAPSYVNHDVPAPACRQWARPGVATMAHGNPLSSRYR